MHFGVTASRGQGRVEIPLLRKRENFQQHACILACVLFNLKMRELFIYLMAFAWYFRVTCQSRAWAHITGMIIAAFLNPEAGWWSGMWGGNFPSPTLSSLLPPHLPSFSQHMDAGVPVIFSRCSVRAHWQKPTSPPPVALACSLPVLHAHTLARSLLQLTVLLKRHFLGPADFLDIIL